MLEIEVASSVPFFFKKLSKPVSQTELENKINKIADYLSNKILNIIFLKTKKSVILEDIKISKSVLTDLGEMDFQIRSTYIIENKKFIVDFLIEHKIGKTSKVLYQLFRDMVYIFYENSSNVIFGIAVRKGYFHPVFSAYKYNNGYVFFTYKINKFSKFAKYKDIITFFDKEKIEKIVEGFRNSSNKKIYAKRELLKLFKLE